MKELLLKHLRKYTDMPDEALLEVIGKIPIKAFAKGTALLTQGDVPKQCFFVFSGLIRQYTVDENGNETSVNFFTEQQTAAVFSAMQSDEPSMYSLECLEDSVLLAGSQNDEDGIIDQFPFLEKMLMAMMGDMMAESQASYAQALSESPEERYRTLLKTRPGLAGRVPQYQLASYLGITPESLSRIKRRLNPAD